MEYTKRRRYTVNQEDNALREIYPHDMQFYKDPPKGEISLKEFQDLGLERRQVLQLVESNVQRSDLKTVEERKVNLMNLLRKDGFTYPAKLLNGLGCATHTDMELQARRRDHISHFILRLAYSQDFELRKWFVQMEVEYFKLRFVSLNKEGIIKLLSLNDFDYVPISQEEKDDLREYLHISTAKIASVDTADFYKVPFQKVSDLVRGRKVYVHKGMAYIPQSELISLFVNQFKLLLMKELDKASENFKMLDDDERLSKFLRCLPNVFSGMTKAVWSTAAVPIESLDELSRISYPMCMRNLHEVLKAEHHLKNGGRMQYGLFLKGIGVTLEDAMRFWRTEFMKKIDLETFEKKYSYDIRHYFGKEGKQTSYTPFGCQKIITGGLGPGESHGCPFRHMSPDTLTQKLLSYGLPASGVSEAMELAKSGAYILACTKCFEVTHKRLPERPFVHPNSYFAQSREIIEKSMSTVSQSSQTNGDRTKASRAPGTPARSVEAPNRSVATPNRSVTTPSRNFGTPTSARTIGTPTAKKLATNLEPLSIEEMLNDDEMDEMMSQM